MLFLALGLLLGILTGIITGLIPGLHINLVSTLITSLTFSTINPLAAAIYLTSLAITHTAIDFIPSIYLGAAEADTFLSVLPGHELLKEGKGYEAVSIAMFGVLMGTVAATAATPFLITTMVKIETLTRNIIPWIILAVCIYVIAREKSPIKAAVLFTLAGFLGFITVNIPLNEPLLPLLSGLFGISGLLISIRKKTQIPEQHTTSLRKIELTKKDIGKATFGAALTALPFSFLPALGSGYGSFIAAELTGQTRRGFIFLNGVMNALVMVLSISIISTLGKARTGAAAGIKEILGENLPLQLPSLLISAVIAALLSVLVGILIARKAAQWLSQINYNTISLIVISLVSLMVAIVSGPIGILVLITSTAIGITVISSGVKRTNLMGALLVPTLMYYLA